MFGQAFWVIHWLDHLSLRIESEVQITWILKKIYADIGWYAFTVTTTSMVSTRRCSSTFHTTSTPMVRPPFSRRWIGRGGPVAWPARSPDLTPLDFFLWGCMKEKVYQTEIASREELVAKINEAAMEIRQHDVDHVQREVGRRAAACVRTGGGQFEHLL